MNETIRSIAKADVIAVTGHRPKSMGWSYDLSDPCWQEVKRQCKEILIAADCKDAWTGMALGVDTIFARAVLELKNEGHDIRLHCAVPFRGQESRWRTESIREYHAILEAADETVVVSPGGFAGWKMTKRDRFMAGKADLIVAVWNGEGFTGTGRCVEHARNNGKRIIAIDPRRIRQELKAS